MNKVYVDKICFKNIQIDKISNIEYLEERGILSGVKYDSNNAFRCLSGQAIQGLSLKKFALMDSLKLSVSLHGNRRVQQCYMDISVMDADLHNLFGYDSIESIWDRLNTIKFNLIKLLGIYLNYDEIQIKSIELQKTFELQDSFNNYDRVCKLIIAQLPRPFKNGSNYFENVKDDNKNKALINGTYYAYSCKSKNITENKYTCLTIYDKAKELEDKFDIKLEKNLMRFEIKIKKSSTIQQKFGSEFLKDLTDEKLQQGYNDIIIKNIINPINDWKTEHLQRIYEILVKNRAKSRTWVIDSLLEIATLEIKTQVPICLSYEDLKQAVDLFEVSKQARYKIKKACAKYLANHETNLQQKGIYYLDEIITNIR